MSAVIFILVAIVLFGLAKTTDSVLETRQSRRDNGVDTKTYL